MSQQTFSNHAKFVPAFHFFLVPVLVIHVVAVTWSFIKWLPATPLQFVAGIFGILMSVALLILAFQARLFALGVQDRVIRLEERLRYQQLLPDELRARIGEFTIDQFVALRFASDGELPDLARRVLDGKINHRKTIKQMIQNWRADTQRI